MQVRIEPRPSKRETIEAIYQAVRAPSWAAPNLDALADILRDLSWLDPGPVELIGRSIRSCPRPTSTRSMTS